MPAPNSIINKKDTKFRALDDAIKLYKEVLSIAACIPKRYTKTGLPEDLVNLAGKVLDNAKIANSIYIGNKDPDEMKRRIKKWKKAREYLQALSSKIDRLADIDGLNFYDIDSRKVIGIKKRKLIRVFDLINMELANLKETIDRERKDYRELTK